MFRVGENFKRIASPRIPRRTSTRDRNKKLNSDVFKRAWIGTYSKVSNKRTVYAYLFPEKILPVRSY